MSTAIGHMERIRAVAVYGNVWAWGGVRTGPKSAITLYDGVASKPLEPIALSAHVLSLCMTGTAVIAGCSDGAVRVFKLTGELAQTLAAHQGECTAVALEPGGAGVLSAGADGFVRRWSLSGGVARGQWALSATPLRAVAIDATGERFAAAGDDGVVRVVTLADDARREMSGHEGAVHALAFTPRDGRLASAGDDGTIRLWYLVGAVEFEARGADDSGHKGAVYALAFGPTGTDEGKETGEKLFSAGHDGAVKVWRLEDKKRTRALTLSSSPARALAVTPPTKNSRGALLVGFDDRGLYAVNLEPNGAPAEYGEQRASRLEVLASDVWGARPARESAVRELAAMEEPEAQSQLREVIENNDMTAVRALAVAEAARFGRRELRAALVNALNGGEDELPRAAFDALRVLDGEDSIAPMRNALASDDVALRLVALDALGALGARVPLAVGMIAGRFDDPDASVRLAALAQWLKLAQSPADALRVAFERAPADVRREVLVHAAQRGLLRDAAFGATVLRALDDADDEVRRTAFTALVVERRALLRALESRDPALAIWVQDLLRRAAQITHGDAAHAPTDKEIKRAREKIPATDTGAEPTEADRAPLLTAIACRSADTGLRGASGLAALGDPRALGALLQLSREAAPGVRAQTAEPLSGLSDPQASRRLTAMLDDNDASVRAQARAAYAKVEGVRALGVAEASLRSSQEDIRVRGLDEVAKIGKGAAAQALLEDALEDVSAQVRSEAFRTLWSWHDKSPEAAFVRAMQARFPDVRSRAVTGLAGLSAKPWARAQLLQAIADRDESVATAAFHALARHKAEDPAPCVAAMATAHGALRARGAQAAVKCPPESVRASLTKLLDDEWLPTRTTAVETLAKLSPNDSDGLYAAIASRFVDLRVRAAELLAERHDDRLIAPMQAVMADKELPRTTPEPAYSVLIARVARALATLGSRALLGYFTDTLLTHANPAVREQGARGLAMACAAGDEGALVDVLSNPLEAARSWAADGLARLGDARALPVLIGNLKNPNLAIRLGAILSFAALGSAGNAGLLQGLDDAVHEAQAAAFTVVLARDLRARRNGEAPELLLAALSSQPAQTRFGAARALELRGDPERYVAFLVNALTPTTDRGAAPKGLPPEPQRTQIMVGLADALAADASAQRYAAAQVLLLRREPERFFREAQRVAAPDAHWVADTDLRVAPSPGETPAKDWLKKLFARDGRTSAALTDADRSLRELAFGAYVGLVRQVSNDEDGHRVRRSAVDRLVELGLSADIGREPVVAALGRALDDPQYLVRKAAFAGLRKVLGDGSDEALELALASTASDVARGALDELGARGAGSLARVAKALNHVNAEVRWHAFQWVEKLSAPASQEPMLMALASDYGDLRIGVIERLASSKDPRVTDALVRAMGSEREDLRLRAAELLARRRDDRAVDALAGFLRAENEAERERALAALSAIGSRSVVQVLGRHLSEATEEREKVIAALGGVRDESALDELASRFNDETLWQEAFIAALAVLGEREKRNDAWALKALRAAVKAREVSLRAGAATELGYVRDDAANGLLTGLFGDREATVRQAAVAAYGRRVTERAAPAEPIERVLRDGARDLVLPAAEAVASRGGTLALQTLLLVARAGEANEQPRAILALGTLADPRALTELELFAAGGTEEIPVLPENRDAAFEALGRIGPKLADAEARQRVIEKVEQASTGGPSVEAMASAVRGLRWIGNERARLLLEGIATNRSANDIVRAEACTALGALGDAKAEAALARVMQDAESYIAEDPYEALRKLFPNERTRVELHALTSSDAEMASRAARFLSTEGTPGALVSRMTDLDASLRKKLLYGLLRRGAAPVAELVALLSHADAGVRADAAWLIGARCAVPEPDASLPWSSQDRTTLENALQEAESAQSTQWAALPTAEREGASVAWAQTVWALGQLHGAAHLARFEALATASAADVPDAVRAEARRAADAHRPLVAREKTLVELVAARDTAGLIARVRSSTDDAAKREAIDALGRAGGDGATALLAALAFDKKSVELPLRKAAFRALRRVQRATQKTRREQRAEA